MTIFSQDQGLGKFASCALTLPDKSVPFVSWAVRVPLSLFSSCFLTFCMVRV